MELKTRNSCFMNALKHRMVESYNKCNTVNKICLPLAHIFHPPHNILIRLPPLRPIAKHSTSFIALYKSKLKVQAKYTHIKNHNKRNAALFSLSKSFCTWPQLAYKDCEYNYKWLLLNILEAKYYNFLILNLQYP